MSAFSEFADAMSSTGVKPVETAADMSRVAILGGGDDARLLAALCLAEGAEVTLFSAYGAELDALKSGVAVRGAGPECDI